MSTLHSLALIALVLATIFVPQVLMTYFSDNGNSKSEEFDFDYR